MASCRMAGLIAPALVCIGAAAATASPASSPTATKPPAARAAASTIAFVDVNVVPMDSEHERAHQVVVIRGDRILSIGALGSSTVPAGVTRIDGRGKWLMPGLIDMHVHFNDPDDGALYVANGVTTVRNMWGFPDVLGWRRDFVAGRRLGPNVYTAGAILDGNPPIWPGSVVIETPEQAEREITLEDSLGYDFVKVYSRLTAPAYEAILAAAKRHHMRVVGHVPDSVSLHRVFELRGQESIEHLTGYLTAAQSAGSQAKTITDWNAKRRAMVAGIDESKIPALARETREAGVWNCVTLVVMQRFAALVHRDSLLQLPEVRYVAPFMLSFWNPANDFRFKGMTTEDYAAMEEVCRFQLRMTRALHDAGAKILLGTDVSNPFVVAGFSAHTELALLVEAGLSPYESLRAGTSDAADFLHASDKLGRVKPGLEADLVLLDADPLADVHAVDRLSGVMLRGRWMPAAELKATLDQVAAARSPGEPTKR